MPQLSPMSWVVVCFFVLFMVSVWWGSVGVYGVLKGELGKMLLGQPKSWGFSGTKKAGYTKVSKGSGFSGSDKMVG
uniref:ATP synthase F0 subunit 8 n=1 Tax=Echyridella menziesii TaxID=981778 RepID=A0A1Y9T620_9BIVA|nr:ATP synthase F0 subunit 8 [Echyridella menziesii]AQT38536.1 ATP synthase F0 subunit 8 [Echyridella menziesii]